MPRTLTRPLLGIHNRNGSNPYPGVPRFRQRCQRFGTCLVNAKTANSHTRSRTQIVGRPATSRRRGREDRAPAGRRYWQDSRHRFGGAARPWGGRATSREHRPSSARRVPAFVGARTRGGTRLETAWTGPSPGKTRPRGCRRCASAGPAPSAAERRTSPLGACLNAPRQSGAPGRGAPSPSPRWTSVRRAGRAST